ncbi:MAG: flavin reductase family protein [Pseudomonadota bacterium]
MNKAVRDEIMSAVPSHSPQDSRVFRDALGQFATGVTVITAMHEGQPVGMTVNSFASVSLDPPLVLWSIGKDSNRFDVFTAVERFAINVLNSDQGGLAGLFARDGSAFSPANSLMWDGVPLIRESLATFDCTLHTTFDGGDHTIILGRVTNVTLGTGKPLVFHQGSFGGFEKS